MKTETVAVRVGEDCGPIDWTHPDAAEMNDTWRDAEKHPEQFQLLLNGMFTPRDIFKLRMYDGWPYWKPTPAIYRESPLGRGEWTYFNDYGVAPASLVRKASL